MAISLSNLQPTLTLTKAFVTSGIYPSRDGSGANYTIDTIRSFAFDFAPGGTLSANGQILPIAQNTAVFSLIGTTYGGNGQTTFALPNLGGKLSVQYGQAPGFANHDWGSAYGTDTFTLTQQQLTPTFGGIGASVDNTQQTLATSYAIIVNGVFPNAGSNGGQIDMIGMIVEFAGNFAPGTTLPCDGRLLSIAENDALYAILGTTYGGDGVTNFALPDLRGRTIIGAGTYNGHTYTVGEVVGAETTSLINGNMPSAFNVAWGQGANNRQPGLVMNQLIAMQGIFPSRSGGALDDQTATLGEVVAFAGTFTPGGYALAQGQTLSIAQNTALFSLLGTTFGGNGQTTFALPDLRGRGVIGRNSSNLIGTAQGADTFTLTTANIPDLNFAGSAGNDRLLSGDGNDSIQGLAGNDALISMLGNDTLIGGAGNDTLIGGGGDDSLAGGDDNDALVGQAGNDTLDAGNGTNELYGGPGDDVYRVASRNDTIVEVSGQGIDRVEASSASFVLAAEIENLTFTGTGAFIGIGNAMANALVGGSGFNTLSGLDGNDTLTGGSTPSELIGGNGDDTYIVSNTGDTIIEGATEGANDQVITSAVSHTLANNVENLTYTGLNSFTGIGNSGNNVLTAGLGIDFLSGLDGNDTLIGGGGPDVLVGGNGADQFRFNALNDRGDRILDFVSGTDKIALLTSAFPKTATVDFVAGTAPVSTNTTIIYDQATGKLYYDWDGTGPTVSIELAQLNAGQAFVAGDLIFI